MTVRYWKVSPGEKAQAWSKFAENNIISIGWGYKLLELDEGQRNRYLQIANKDEFVRTWMSQFEYSRIAVEQIWNFLHEMQINDVVLANKGKFEIIGVGLIESGYMFNEDPVIDDFHLERKVYWVLKDLTITVPKDIGNKFNITVLELDKDTIKRIGVDRALNKHIEKAQTLLKSIV